MANTTGGNGLTSSDLWRWALAGMVSLVLAGGTIAVNQWASAQTATTNRIEAKQGALDARVQDMATDGAAFQVEVRWRLNRIEDSLGVGASDGTLPDTSAPVDGFAGLPRADGVIGDDGR